ncbi:MAG: NADPH:quinone reductase, partial [Acidimicrobiaceae bacterium]|nr:NADPH:quinone reductase [Acidimicrobiaceae bacterium]
MPNTPAIRFAETGGPEVLQITEVELAEPGPGQALIAVHASGVNFIDTYHRSGLYSVDLPFIPGSEGAGIVEAVGADVTDVAVGDHVAWVGVPGSYAGHVLAPTDALLSVPDGVSLDIAAAVPLQGMTAHYLVSDTKPLQPGDRCLIHAAAGG